MAQVQEARALIGDDPGIAAAVDAMAEGISIQPDLIDDLPPPAEPAMTEHIFDLSDFTNSYSEEELFEDEGDPFALWDEPEDSPQAGLVEAARQNALAELANVVFEEDGAVAPTTIPREELNMLIIQAIDLQSRDDLTEAIGNYNQAVKAGMSSSAILFNLGLLNKEVGQYDEASKMLRASAQSEKYGLPSHFALGQTYHAIGDLETALRHFIEAVKLVDTTTVDQLRVREMTQHYETLADIYLSEGDEKKINDFIASLETFFSRPDWENKVFEARQRMDSVAENGSGMTLAEFLETVETEVVITSLALTQEYIRRNLLMTASEECLRAIQRVPSSLLLHVRLADVLMKQDQSDAAITKYLTVAKVYLIRNQLDKAINIYQKILRLAPMDVTVRSKLIDLYISTQSIEQALDEYLVLANSYYQLAQVDRALEKYSEALRLTANLEDADTWKVEILSQIGDIYNQRFDWTGATGAFEELLQINPQDERVLRQVVDLYFKQRKIDQAVETLNKLLRLYQQRNQPEKSLDLLKDLVGIYPEELDLRRSLAEAYSQSGMKQAAIAEYDALGEMQLEKGLRGQAMRTIEAILDLEPEDVEGYRRLLEQIGGGAE
jgi:tetratricopeptide (TPR) repeat protein